jgi:hypothetical protein
MWLSPSPTAFAALVDEARIFIQYVGLASQLVATQDSLQQAIAARHRVGIAQGILMTRHQLSADEAFNLLRQQSSYTNVKLRLIADAVIESGELTDAKPLFWNNRRNGPLGRNSPVVPSSTQPSPQPGP